MEQLQVYEMESKRLYFRKLRANDFSLVSPILQDEKNMYARKHAFSYDEVCDWIADMLRRYRQDGCGYYAAIDKASHVLVGLVGLMVEHPSADETTIELGCLIRRALWNQGYGTECAQTLLAFAFDQLHAERVISIIHPNDLPSFHVAANCRMQIDSQKNIACQGRMVTYIVCSIDRQRLASLLNAAESVPPEEDDIPAAVDE